jgi:hypothetical protein
MTFRTACRRVTRRSLGPRTAADEDRSCGSGTLRGALLHCMLPFRGRDKWQKRRMPGTIANLDTRCPWRLRLKSGARKPCGAAEGCGRPAMVCLLGSRDTITSLNFTPLVCAAQMLADNRAGGGTCCTWTFVTPHARF